MIESVNMNAGVVRPTERTLPSETLKTSPSAGAAAQQDTAELSPAGREHEAYMSVLRGLPDVRQDVVQKVRDSLRPTVDYPPIQIVEGLAKMIGTVI